MSTNRLDLIEQLESAFIEPRPLGNINASSDDESKEDTEPFRGRNWKELDLDLIEKCQQALFWFTPEAFRYYLPAFIRASLIADNPNAVYVHSILHLMNPEFSKATVGGRRERWQPFTGAQIAVLELWLAWLKNKAAEGYIFPDVVENAAAAIENRIWWTQ